ncbi:sensor histidine kinase [Fontivita pretiosa]|uniref:sensor histidine kinase n=1 Tax=Fontivita pretiosa TaxID=2989684 RepID=UPI003D183112
MSQRDDSGRIPGTAQRRGPLLVQLRWFIRLRWLAGLIVTLGAMADMRWLGWFAHSPRILLVGIAIVFYNLLLWWTLHVIGRRPIGPNRRALLLLSAWAQLLLDMFCLTLLVIWTGGVDSPLTPFYVLHMVFASLLLPRAMAYAGAAAVIIMYCAALWATRSWPAERNDRLMFAARILTLLATVHLANHITRSLRSHRRRLLRQNRRIRLMTRQLKRQQRAMIQHEKMVALGQMAAGVTHEIANPLASMDSLLQLMQRKPDRVRPEAIATLREQIDRINQIIQQMKTFAHPAEMQRQTVELNEVVEQALHMLRFDKRLKQVRLERQYSPQAGRVWLLPQALQQVLVNLIINALDAMSQTPEPVLTIRTDRREGWCLIEVSDNGTGILPEHMGRLFEPFFTTKPPGKGTGLGLSISYSLIQKQGGSITVRSQPGKGASFIIRLPVQAAASDLAQAAGSPANGKTQDKSI